MKAAIERGKAKKPAPPPKKKPKPGRSAAARDKRVEARGPLPDGSSLAAVWNKGRMEWRGEMIVKGEGGQPDQKFHGTLRGVFRLLESLDDKYREHLKGETK